MYINFPSPHIFRKFHKTPPKMVDKGEGYQGYQDLKDNTIYHGYQPLKPRKQTKFSAEFGLGSGMLNIATARDIESIPKGDNEDASQYQYLSAHKVKKDVPVENPMLPELKTGKPVEEEE